MKRRPNGHSSLFKAYDGRWHGWVTMNLGVAGADRDRRHVSGKTRAVVLAKVADLERERSQRDTPTPGDPIETVGEWIRYWLVYIAERRTKARTAYRYRLILERHVVPRLGKVKLRDLHEHHMDDLFSSMVGEGSRPTTMREVRRVFSTVLNDAVARELVVRNVTYRASMPRATGVEVQPLSVDEAQQVFAVAALEPNGAAWVVALALGLRRAEVLGLHWEDIDFALRTLSVRQTLDWKPWSHGCPDPGACCFDQHTAQCGAACRAHAISCPQRQGGATFGAPKSSAAHRTLVMPPSLTQALEAHRRAQESIRRRQRNGGLVFHDGDGGPINPARHSAEWKLLLKRAGVRQVRLHDARHSAATYLLMQGVDARTAMALMGWAHVEMSERYQHVVTPLRVHAAERIEDLLWGEPKLVDRRIPSGEGIE